MLSPVLLLITDQYPQFVTLRSIFIKNSDTAAENPYNLYVIVTNNGFLS